MTPAFVVGYDPGGNGKHGVAALRIRAEDGRWRPLDLQVTSAKSLSDVVAWVTDVCHDGRILAAGVDTLTEWNSGRSGWRPADLFLIGEYPHVAKSVVAPASLYGAMVINGTAFLMMLASRFRTDATTITEAHPKLCYFALTGRKAAWREHREEMAGWLAVQLGIELPHGILSKEDHCFDAAMSVLAALRGLNRQWKVDLHALPTDTRVKPIGQTHYWWPSRADSAPEERSQ